MMRALDLFSAAAGGWSLGLHRAGFLTIAACEIIEWRRVLYAENNPDVRLYGDIRSLTAARLLSDLGVLPDIIVGSPPCQDISSANAKGKGIDGERSGLYLEAVRLVGECRPRWFAFENSSNLRTRGADRLLDALETLGYACEPCVVAARDVGANHVRKRSWLIGYDPEQLADPDGFRWEAGRSGRRSGIDISATDDSGDAPEIGCGSGRPGRHIEPVAGPCEPPCRNDADAGETQRRAQVECAGDRDGTARDRRESADRHAEFASPCGDDAADPGGVRLRQQQERIGRADTIDPPHDPQDDHRDAAHADEARRQDGLLERGLRAAKIADDGRGDERRDNGLDADSNGEPVGTIVDREMGGSAGVGDDAAEPWADWNGGLAHHLRLDDGLSAWVADTRIALGSPKGKSAAGLIVEAFGDAVLPQIPEAIGRAILRTETALAAVLGRTPRDILGDET